MLDFVYCLRHIDTKDVSGVHPIPIFRLMFGNGGGWDRNRNPSNTKVSILTTRLMGADNGQHNNRTITLVY
jgi:hypothetical protein